MYFLFCVFINFLFLVRGGFTEVFRMCWKKSTSEILYNFDMISAYAYAAMSLLPIGKYEVRWKSLSSLYGISKNLTLNCYTCKDWTTRMATEGSLKLGIEYYKNF